MPARHPLSVDRMSHRESPTPSPSPPPASHLAPSHHRPSALDALRHLAAPSAAEAPARAASPYGAPSPGLSPPDALGFAVAAQAGPPHGASPAAASPSVPPPRFAEKQLPPEFLAGGTSGLDEPSPSPPAHLAATVAKQHGPGEGDHAMQQSLPAQVGAVRSSQQRAAAGFQAGSGPDGVAVMAGPSDTVRQPAQLARSHANDRPAPCGVGVDEPSQQPEQQQQQPDYDIAPEHQFRIVSSDDESSDSDNSNSGTGY